MNELKVQITEIVNEVLSDNSNRHITIATEDDLKKTIAKKKATTPKAKAQTVAKASNAPEPTVAPTLQADDSIVGKPCPQCKQGVVIKGKGAYGCSNWKAGCNFRLPFNEA